MNSAEDVFACPQVAARGMLMPVDDPEVGEYRYARTPLHMSSAPKLPADPAPALGGNSREILKELLGYDAGRIDALVAGGVVECAED